MTAGATDGAKSIVLMVAAAQVNGYHARVQQVQIITPHRETTSGNAATAERWARKLRELKLRVRVAGEYDGEPCDLLVALHAHKSARSVQRFNRLFPQRPVIVALTGTDVYRDLARSPRAQRSLDLARRLIVLQRLALDELSASQRRKARVVLQSVEPLSTSERNRRRKRERASGNRTVEVAVLANLRHVKDPLRTAFAVRGLPAHSRVRVVHAGRAFSPAYREHARKETRQNARYTWVGAVSPRRARSLLVGSDVLVLSSRLEGGANVVSEAIVCGVPVLASEIPGSVGLLGASYPGYFPVGDASALAALLQRFESEPRFGARLRRHVRRLAPRFTPARERAAWRDLLREL